MQAGIALVEKLSRICQAHKTLLKESATRSKALRVASYRDAQTSDATSMAGQGMVWGS